MKEKFASHKMDDETLMMSAAIRQEASELDDLITGIPESREKSLALTKLEECIMWVNKALALHGMK